MIQSGDVGEIALPLFPTRARECVNELTQPRERRGGAMIECLVQKRVKPCKTFRIEFDGSFDARTQDGRLDAEALTDQRITRFDRLIRFGCVICKKLGESFLLIGLEA